MIPRLRRLPLSRLAAVLAALVLAAGAHASPSPPVALHDPEAKALFERMRLERARLDGACSARPPRYPPADPNPAYDVLHYALMLNVDPVPQRLDAVAAITLRVLRPDTTTFVTLDYCGPPIIEVLDGATPTLYAWGNGVLTVGVSGVAGDTVTVTVRYAGATEFFHGIHWAPPQYPESPSTFTFNEPEDARYWFPCHDAPIDKATLLMQVIVPSDHVVAGNGVLDADSLMSGGKRLFRWIERAPIATYLIAFAAAPYAVLHDDRLPGVPIVNYVYRPDSASAVRCFDRVPDMIRHFASLFGPYPFPKYGHAAAFFPGGMEHQSMTLIVERAARDSAAYQQLIAHELAHQWFGDAVTLADWRHIWLNEGFATYGDALWYEHVFGADSLHARMALFGSFYKNAADLGLLVPLVDPPSEHLLGTTTYNRGAWVLHMLRHIVGDATFFAILRDYFAVHAYGNATSADFVAAAERVSVRPLGWLFEPWLHGVGYPKFRYAWRADTLDGGEALVSVDVAQTQDSTLYPMPVDFEFRTARGAQRRTVFLEGVPQSWAVLLDGPPLAGGVILDPDHWILASVEQGPLPPIPIAPSRLVSVSALRNPGPAPVALRVTLTAGAPVPLRVDIHDLQGRRVATPYRGPAGSGVTQIVWNGAVDRGGRAAGGIYFARVMEGSRGRTLRIALTP